MELLQTPAWQSPRALQDSVLSCADSPPASEAKPSDCCARMAAAYSAKARDAEWVRRFNAGDEKAFVSIVAHYRAKMVSIGLALLHNYGDAEEIAQDTFVRAYRALGTFRGDATLSSWLHCIALNLSRSRYRYFSRRFRHATLSLDEPVGSDGATTIADMLASEQPDPACEASMREYNAHMSACISRLCFDQSQILLQRYRLNNSYNEIASRLGINKGTVKSRIARARHNLRLLIGRNRDAFEGQKAVAAGPHPSELVVMARTPQGVFAAARDTMDGKQLSNRSPRLRA